MGATAALERQSQADRTARMRQKLLDATLQCLAEKGYAATSTNEVVKRAGVSRGALAHHFSSKAELVAEAAASLISSRIRSTNEEIARSVPPGEGLERRLRLTWEAYERLFAANIEFMVAARTDLDLRAYFARAIERYDFGEGLTSAAAEEPWLDGDPSPILTRYAMGCFIRGLCLERVVNSDALVEQIFDKFVTLMGFAMKAMREEAGQAKA